MRARHLNLSNGHPMDVVAEAHSLIPKLLELTRASPRTPRSRALAFAEGFVIFAGEANDDASLTDIELRALINEMRAALAKPRTHRELSPQEIRLLKIIGQHKGPVATNDLEESIRLSRSTLNQVLYDLSRKGVVVKQPGSRMGLWSLTEKSEQYRAERPIRSSSGALLPSNSPLLTGGGHVPVRQRTGPRPR